VVSFHGGLSTSMPAAAGQVKASVLVLNGADDSYVSNDEIAGLQTEMTAAGADWQFVNFAGAVHCFAEADANSPGCTYHERSAKRAYRLMDDFFAEAFGG
jgi:dienelactone hydrolase